MTVRSQLLGAHAAGRIVRPCQEALDWAGDRDLPTAWDKNPRGEWSLWVLQQAGVKIPLEWVAREVVAPAFDCAATDLRVTLPGHATSLSTHANALRGATAETARSLLTAAGAARDDGAAARVAWVAWVAWVARAAGAAGSAAQRRCADAVRARWPVPPPEVVAMLEGP